MFPIRPKIPIYNFLVSRKLYITIAYILTIVTIINLKVMVVKRVSLIRLRRKNSCKQANQEFLLNYFLLGITVRY